MLTYTNIKKIAIQIGPIKIYWYGIMYILGFFSAWILAKIRSHKSYHWSNETITDFVFYCAVGAVIGGRLGYILFYDFETFIHAPMFVFKIWLGGMSFHGGLIGLMTSLLFFSRKMQLPFITIIDFAAPLAPLGLAFGRIGNFINSELLGRTTTMPWGIIFPNGGPLPRHPSQLYEAFAEGIVLFVVIWSFSAKPKPQGATSALFLLVYGVIRVICEFFREPDIQIGFVAFNWLTMGQLLSIPMIAVGIIMLIWSYKHPQH